MPLVQSRLKAKIKAAFEAEQSEEVDHNASLDRIADEFGKEYFDYLQKQARKFIDDELLFVENKILKPTLKGKFLTDGIASDLFYLNLK